MKELNLLKRYCSAVGVSGFEQDITDLFVNEMSAIGISCEIDSIGNAYAKMNEDDVCSVMIEAHCDEIGFQVINITDSGLLYVRRNGGIDEQCLPGSIVVIRTVTGEYIEGIIGKKPVHLMSQDDRRRTSEIHQLWIDTALEPQKVKEKISIGDTLCIAPNFRILGQRIVSKGLDNRVGVFVISEVMKRLSNYTSRPDVWAVATTQEEVGSRGAVVAAYKCNPAVAITVDLDFATDTPDMNVNKYGNISLGKGVILPVNADTSSRILKKLIEICQSKNIPFQKSARPHATGGTNTSRIQLSRNGINTISLGIPGRYMHTPVEMCDTNDIKSTIDLLVEFCLTYNK